MGIARVEQFQNERGVVDNSTRGRFESGTLGGISPAWSIALTVSFQTGRQESSRL